MVFFLKNLRQNKRTYEITTMHSKIKSYKDFFTYQMCVVVGLSFPVLMTVNKSPRNNNSRSKMLLSKIFSFLNIGL